MPIRLDASRPKKFEKLSNGFLRASASLTRVGVFPYKTNKGETRLELRSEEEVFHKDSIASFEQLPIVIEHPAEMLVTSENAHRYAKGNLGEKLERDGDKLTGTLMVTHQDAITGIESGKHAEISCGYSCDLVAEAGTWNGRPYTHKQVNIRGNHIALTAKGRMGPDVRVHMDSADAISPDLEASTDYGSNTTSTRSTETMEKISINGVEVEVSTTAAQLIKAERSAVTKGDAANAEKLTAAEKRADSAEGELTQLRKVHADSVSVERLDAMVAERTALLSDASLLIGKEFKADGKDAQSIKLEVLAKLHPDEKLTGRSADFIDAYFLGAVKTHKATAHVRGDSASAQVARATAAVGAAPSAAADAFKAMQERNSFKRADFGIRAK